MNIKLSICIPTRNRADALEQSLESLVSKDFFKTHEDIEIVISDNASTDHTRAVVDIFVSRYGQRIRYYRNERDIGAHNLEAALRHGRGVFLKLANDTILWKNGGLDTLYDLVIKHEVNQPVIFMLNGCKKTESPTDSVNGADPFLQRVSFFVSWIGAFGIWSNQLAELTDFSRSSETLIPQIDVLLRLISKNPSVIICNVICFSVQDVGRKGGYSLAQVYGQHYIKILKNYSNILSEETIKQEKKRVLLGHILPYHFDRNHDFHLFPLEEFLDAEYHQEPYYLISVQKARQQWIEATRGIYKKDRYKAWRTKFKHAWTRFVLKVKPNHRASLIKLWRMNNAHNDTSIVDTFDFSRVTVGRGSYGQLNIHSWGHQNERLNIGSFVSIAGNVQFLLGGNHELDTFSTYPFKVMLLGQHDQATTKGPINIKDDVWIGYGAIILSGVTVHQGAVVAAGAMVVSDVPPYAIVAGNPAKIIKFRFSDEVIEKLTKISIADISEDLVIANPHLIAAKVSNTNIDELIRNLQDKKEGLN